MNPAVAQNQSPGNVVSTIHGLYAVTPDESDTVALARKVREALVGGARLVQYRNKTADEALARAQARLLCGLCREHGAKLIVNDSLALALEVDAHGVHLGRDDGRIDAARAALGPEKVLGVSCYDRLEAALAAEAAGADYVAFGSFFPSTVKPGAVRAPLALLREGKSRLTVPIVAIGGIDPQNAPELLAAGADALAVISALFAAPDIRRAAQDFSLLFER